MKKLFFVLCSIILLASFAERDENHIVEIYTEYGNIKIKLYDETPIHRDNFIKLVQDSAYNGILFHRVYKNFMIQAGDPKSRDAESGAMLGNNSIGENLPAEILPQFFHKRGALATARTLTNNPERKSSGSQFFLVQGFVYTPDSLQQRVDSININRKHEIEQQLMQSNQAEDTHLLDSLYQKEKLVLTPEQQQAYTTIGGLPHLDGRFTIFGEVLEGLDVIEKITLVEANEHGRPTKDIPIKAVKILK